MIRSKFPGIIMTLAICAVVALASGCGSGGGGGSTAVKTSSLSLRVELPRVANSEIASALIQVVSYDAYGNATVVADSDAVIAYNQATGKYEGSFSVTNIPVGSNYICKVTGTYTYTQTTAPRAANQTYTFARVGAIVPEIADGVSADVLVSSESTVAALALLKYALSNGVALNNTSSITSAKISSVSSAAESLISSGEISASTVSSILFSSTDPFTTAGLSANASTLATVLNTASLSTTAPQVSSFVPATGATGVLIDGTVFGVVFNKAMDTSVNLNNQSTLSASGFTITVVNSSSGGSLTINSSNALSYGTFAWSSSTYLTYTLKPRLTLINSGLQTLDSATTYNISSFVVPTNLRDVSGASLSSTGIPTTGSFTTATTSAPAVSSFVPASGATGVASDGTVFGVVFNKAMDTTVDLNNQTALSASGFMITVVKSSNGASLTITSSNALNYGTFAWSSSTYLTYTLKASSVLAANGLQTLDGNTTYSISSFVVPTNLRDASGLALNTSTNIPSTGTFTTAASGDVTPPTVTLIAPVSTTAVRNDGPSIVLRFNEAIDPTSVNSASNISFTFTKSGGSSFVINSSNADSYGTVAISTTTYANDTVTYTLKTNNQLSDLGLTGFSPSSSYTYSIVPPAVKDVAGNTFVSATLTGTFTTDAVDYTAPRVSSFSVTSAPPTSPVVSPSNSATGVYYNMPSFSVNFNETMTALDLNNQTNLAASGFSITIQNPTGVTLTINSTNALNYGAFSWPDAPTHKILTYTLKDNSILAANGLKTLVKGTTYSITSRTVPTNLKDAAGNALDTSVMIPTTGTFTTLNL